jgi:DNA-binding NtrC family response regulator
MSESPSASVLVVDDDTGVRTLSRVILELEGFVVREAANLEQADAALAEERPDVVVLDVHLGHTSSDVLFDRLRAEGIPVIAVTGTVDVAEYRGRSDAALMKPFEPDDLVETTLRVISKVREP